MNIIKRTRGPQGTDLGMDGHGGPGKGSRARNNYSAAFRSNFDRIFRAKKRSHKR